MFDIQNITKKPGGGAGAAVPNKPNVTFVLSKDVLARPIRDARGVKLQGNYVLNPGAKMFTVYGIPSKQKQSFAAEGEEDMMSFKQTYELVFPGDTLEANELFQYLLGEDVEIIADNCVDGHKRVFGTACSPMKLKNSYEASSSGRMHTLNFSQEIGTQFVPAFYYGELVFANPTATDVTIDVTVANGTHYKVAPLETTAAISIASIDQPAGKLITILGSGGGDPATLANGASTAATFILKDGTTWTALDNATITFRVFEDGSDTFLIEESRT
jgi:hypothetical protein